MFWENCYPVAVTEVGEAMVLISGAGIDVAIGTGVDDCPFAPNCTPLTELLSSRIWGRHLVRSFVVGAFASSSTTPY